jgi:hypothetical protein
MIAIAQSGNNTISSIYGLTGSVKISSSQTSRVGIAYGLDFETQYTGRSGASAGTLVGARSSVYITDSSTVGIIDLAIGNYSNLLHNTSSASSVLEQRGFYVGGSVPAGGITTNYGLLIDNFSTGAGTIGTNYGVYIPEMTLGTNKYPIWLGGVNPIFFRGSGNYIYSSAANTLDFTATTLKLNGATKLNGAEYQTITSKVFSDSPYTVVATDRNIVYDATSGASTINLPVATGSGRVLDISKKDSVNLVTVTPNGADTIEGAATYVLMVQYQDITLLDSASGLWLIK